MSGPTTPASEADLTPAQRLAISREHLRSAMRTPPRGRASGIAGALRERVRSNSTLSLLLEIAETWWRRHPMRGAATLAGEASRAVVTPLARRNPIRFVLLAFVGGVLIAWLRPWRLLTRRRFFGSLTRQVLSRVIASVPSATWISMVAGLTGRAATAPSAMRSPRPDP